MQQPQLDVLVVAGLPVHQRHAEPLWAVEETAPEQVGPQEGPGAMQQGAGRRGGLAAREGLPGAERGILIDLAQHLREVVEVVQER